MKLKITKTKLDKELKNFVKEIKSSKEITAYRQSIYTPDQTQKLLFFLKQLNLVRLVVFVLNFQGCK